MALCSCLKKIVGITFDGLLIESRNRAFVQGHHCRCRDVIVRKNLDGDSPRLSKHSTGPRGDIGLTQLSCQHLTQSCFERLHKILSSSIFGFSACFHAHNPSGHTAALEITPKTLLSLHPSKINLINFSRLFYYFLICLHLLFLWITAAGNKHFEFKTG
jgi:hypothetical protein